MAKILIKRSNISGYVPTKDKLSTGELELNTFDGKLYMRREKSSGSDIVEIGKDALTATRLATSRKINGVSFDGTADISFGTNSVVEHPNFLYYTQARFDDAFAAKSTDDLMEGGNLYYTNARASAAAPVQTVAGRKGAVTLSVTDVSGALAIAGGTMTGFLTLSANPTAAYHAATKLYVDTQITNGTAATANKLTTARLINNTSFDGTADISFSTSNVAEGTNLYFTTARARASISASGNLSYNSTTGAITYNTPANGYGAGDFKANGTVTMTGTFKGLDAQLTGTLQYGYVRQASWKATAIRQTTPYVVFSYPIAYQAVKLFIKVLETGTNNLHLVEMLVMNDGTTATHTEYGLLTTNDELCEFSFAVSASGVSLIVTPISSLDKEVTVSLTSLID